MATPSDIDAVLSVRAEKLASRNDNTEVVEAKTPVSVISAGDETFGIPTQYLSCIIKAPPIAKMPNLPPWLQGIAQIRGELVGVVNIAKWFGVPGSCDNSFLAVVEDNGRKLGLLLDAVGGFRDIGASDIAETFSTGTAGGHPIHATTKDVTTILDIPKMFANPDMCVGAVGEAAAGQPSVAEGSESTDTESQDAQ